ncbi:hypothetical protein V6N13_121930 [Hibiscus sabdariffa]
MKPSSSSFASSEYFSEMIAGTQRKCLQPFRFFFSDLEVRPLDRPRFEVCYSPPRDPRFERWRSPLERRSTVARVGSGLLDSNIAREPSRAEEPKPAVKLNMSGEEPQRKPIDLGLVGFLIVERRFWSRSWKK